MLYHIVITTKDKPASRGFIEKIGSYSPNKDKWGNKYIFIQEDRLFHWICKGATLDTPLTASLLGPVFRIQNNSI